MGPNKPFLSEKACALILFCTGFFLIIASIVLMIFSNDPDRWIAGPATIFPGLVALLFGLLLWPWEI